MRPLVFQPREHYQPHDPGYRLLPFRFMRWDAGDVLLVNDVGEFTFVSRDAFEHTVHHRLAADDPLYLELKAKHLLCDGTSLLPLELLATKYRTKKSFLRGFTKLHMFVVTLRCDHTCRYCQVSRVSLDRSRYDMTEEVARQAVDLMFRSPSPELKVEFQGGEALLNFDLIRIIVDYVERRNQAEGRHIEFVVATNLVPLTDEILDFLAAHSVLVSTSLDGPAFIHDANRPRPGRDSHAIVVANIERVRRALGHDRISAIMTTSAMSLQHPIEIVDEYVRLGFTAIFLRPISPYGFAVRTGETARYEMDEFLSFYRKAFDHIVELNRQSIAFVEIYAQILLRKILTPFATGYVDLQSPAGTAISCVAYNYDGLVYASDESRMLAEMGDRSFCLGHVGDGFEALFGGATASALAAGSVLETLPGCHECAFLPYCGSDPVFNYRVQGDIVGHRPTSAFCRKNMAIIKYLFDVLRHGDAFTRELLTSWATGVSASDREWAHAG